MKPENPKVKHHFKVLVGEPSIDSHFTSIFDYLLVENKAYLPGWLTDRRRITSLQFCSEQMGMGVL